MHMTMDEIAWLIPVEQRQKRLEAHMRVIVPVADAPYRGVRHHDVHAACPADLPAELPDAVFHLALGILILAARIQAASAQPRNAQAVEHDQLIFNAVAALRRTPVIIAVVVAAHIIKRRAAKRSQK